MIDRIKTYELPGSAILQDFQIYEVKGGEIANKRYPHKTDRPHRHSYYEVCLFMNGAGKHEIDFNTYPILSNSVHFLSPGQVHRIFRDKDYHGYLIVFSSEFFPLGASRQENPLFYFPFFNNPTLLPVLDLDGQAFDEILLLVRQMKKESDLEQQSTSEILRAYLQLLLLKCKRHYMWKFAEKQNISTPYFAQVQQFNMLVEKKFMEHLLIQDYAELLGMSPATLNRAVKKIIGKTAAEIIVDRLILQAKRLLIYTDLSNKEIAFSLNYADPSYFTRTFKKKTGKSPSQFKKELNEKYQH